MPSDGPWNDHLLSIWKLDAWFDRSTPIVATFEFSDSDAFTPNMSHVVPGCEFRLWTNPAGSFTLTPPTACQPLCAPYFVLRVAPIESATDTHTRSLPRRSFRSTYSMQAWPRPP